MDQVKVGGETSAYCTSCRDMRHHVVVAMVGRDPARVECLSCHKQHNYKAAPPGTRAAGGAARKKAEPGTAPRRTRAKAADAADAAPHPLDALLAVRPESEARTYTPFERYEVGDLVSHPSFGLGAVSSMPGPGKIEVIFRDSAKLLMHERPPAGSSQPKLQPPPRREDAPKMTGASDAPPKR